MPNRRFSRRFVEETFDGATVVETDTIYYSDTTSFYRQHGRDLHFYGVTSLPGGGADTTEVYSGILDDDGLALTILTDDGSGVAYRDEYRR